MDTNKRNIIRSMETLEETVEKLYREYTKIFPSEYSFWIQLSKEEEEHVKYIQELEKEVDQGNILFENQRLKKIFSKHLEQIRIN